ncbi:MAG TPA: universal stress protein [Bacteroidales bacterium]|nr:universal stress protein [Bacteroidales bacterium]
METLTNSVDKIVFPTDFTDLAMNALKVAIKMCKRHNAALHLVNTVELDYYSFSIEPYSSAVYSNQEVLDAAKANLSRLKEDIEQKEGIQCFIHVEPGNPAHYICSVASEEVADLIIMATHGASGFREFFIGSNAYKVVKHAPCPVLTIPGSFKSDTFNKILFPIRSTAGIEEKYEVVKTILLQKNTQLEVTGIVDKNRPEQLTKISDSLSKLKLRMVDENVNFHSDLFYASNIAGDILKIADEKEVDLLAINATLDYNWREMFIGPYTQQVVNHSHIPVLSFKPVIESRNMREDTFDKYYSSTGPAK